MPGVGEQRCRVADDAENGFNNYKERVESNSKSESQAEALRKMTMLVLPPMMVMMRMSMIVSSDVHYGPPIMPPACLIRPTPASDIKRAVDLRGSTSLSEKPRGAPAVPRRISGVALINPPIATVATGSCTI